MYNYHDCGGISGNFGDVRLINMTLDIVSQAQPAVSTFEQIMAEEQRFGEPPGKHPVDAMA